MRVWEDGSMGGRKYGRTGVWEDWWLANIMHACGEGDAATDDQHGQDLGRSQGGWIHKGVCGSIRGGWIHKRGGDP